MEKSEGKPCEFLSPQKKRIELPAKRVLLLLMAEILHHLRCMQP